MVLKYDRDILSSFTSFTGDDCPGLTEMVFDPLNTTEEILSSLDDVEMHLDILNDELTALMDSGDPDKYGIHYLQREIQEAKLYKRAALKELKLRKEKIAA